MPSKDKQLVPFRMYKDDYERLKEKCHNDTLSYQKLVEILVVAYVKDNPDIKKIVDKYISDRKQNKNNILDEEEVTDIFRLLQEASPLNREDNK